MRWLQWLGPTLSATLVLFGCAALGPQPRADVEAPSILAASDQNGWWQARYRINWPPDSDPYWYVDLYIAHQIVAPVLTRYRSEIVLWRFHRRAVRDDSGHQFSFLFYTTAQTAGKIYTDLRSDRRVQLLKSGGKLLQDDYDDIVRRSKPQIEDTSDPGWTAPVRKSWPYFIMGVSRMWLQLISEIADQTPAVPPPASRETEFYQQVQVSMTNLWQTEARHAFLHHLNALFAYEPIIVYEKRYLQF